MSEPTRPFPRTALADTGLEIARFILGTGNLGGIAAQTGPGIGLDEAASGELLAQAEVNGISVLDCSDLYAKGESERILGRWLAANPDSGFTIQTKTGFTATGPDLSPARIRSQLANSIRTLGRVDLYLAHTVDPNTPWSASLPVFHQAIEDGQITAYGLSNVTEADLTAALETADSLGIRRPSIIQNRYSLLTREDDLGVLPLARSESLAYTPYSPLAAGLLAGRYRAGEQAARGSRLSTAAPALEALSDQAIHDQLARYGELAEAHDVTPAALALAWLLHCDGVTAPIIGVSKPSQWDAALAAPTVAWSPQLAGAIAEIFPDPAA